MEATFPYRGNAFFNKPIMRLVETDFLSGGNSVFYKSYFSASGSLLLELRRKSLFFLVDNRCSGQWKPEAPASDSFFWLVETMFQENGLHFGQWKWILELIIVSASRKRSLNKRIIFPLNKNYDSTSRNEGFITKMFPLHRKTAFKGRNVYKTRRKWFSLARKLL